MNTFLFGDQTLISAFNFKELPRLNGAVGFSAIHVELLEPQMPGIYQWQHEWKEADNTVTLALALHPCGFLIRFPELCDFILDVSQRRVQVLPHEVLDEYTIEHLLVDQILPRLLAHQGQLLLHASAVNIHGRTVLFLGKSGWGKSTLAALFHEAAYPLYSDDCVMLQQRDAKWQVLATYPSLRLYEDSIDSIFSQHSELSPVSEYSDKQRISLAVKPAQIIPPLHALYFLSDPESAPEDIHILPMSAANTCIELIQRSFQLDLSSREHSQKLMTLAAKLTQSVPAYRLSYPHSYQDNHRLLEYLVQHTQQ